jgi:hypothetical protein
MPLGMLMHYNKYLISNFYQEYGLWLTKSYQV